MRTLDVTYRTIWGAKKIHIDVAERWEDLRPAQFEVCARLHVAPPEDEVFLQEFFGLKKSLIRQLTKFEIFRLIDMVGFAVKPEGTTNHFYLEEIPGTGLKAPSAKLGSVSMEQFALVDTCFFEYANDPDEKKLARFVAALYLKKGEVLTKINFTKRVDFVQNKVDKCTMYAIFLNYIFIRKWLARSFRFLFEEGSDEPVRHKSARAEKAKNKLPKWVDIIDNFVGEDILNYDKYTQLNCIRAFKVMNSRIKNFNKNAR